MLQRLLYCLCERLYRAIYTAKLVWLPVDFGLLRLLLYYYFCYNEEFNPVMRCIISNLASFLLIRHNNCCIVAQGRCPASR